MPMDPTAGDDLTDSAVRLFEFLMRAQEVRDEPARTVEAYRRDGAVVWFADLPHHPAVHTVSREGEPDAETPLLTVERVLHTAPPEPDGELSEWLDGPRDDPSSPPRLRASIVRATGEPGDDGVSESRTEYADERPDVAEGFATWMRGWQAWADQERRDQPVQELYRELFAMYDKALGHAEELELVVGVGCLAWTPSEHPTVRRHLLTAAVAIEFDQDTARLSVVSAESAAAAGIEIEMLEPRLVNQPQVVAEARVDARDVTEGPLDRAVAGAIVRRIAYSLSPDASYQDADKPPVPAEHPVVAFAPALILRRRARTGLVEIFRTIVDQLRSGTPVPAGVLPLIDPDHVPAVDPDEADGAVLTVDDDAFLPMPVNSRQLEILRRVDTHAQTVVQGPPGTGKTHTAAALISHLLAQGKRVLVTAHTDRALKEVREKLPADVQPLAVSVVGSTRQDMADLRVAVERIAATAAEHEPAEARAQVERTLQVVEALRQRRACVYEELRTAREDEVRTHTFAGYHGTLAAIAGELAADGDRHGWLAEFVEEALHTAPLDSAEIVEWHALLVDAELTADEPDARRRPYDPAGLPEPARFADLVDRETSAAAADARFAHMRGDPVAAGVAALPRETRDGLRTRMHKLVGELDYLAARPEQWMATALRDVRTGRADLWHARYGQVTALAQEAGALAHRLGPVTQVQVRGAEVAGLVPVARELLEYVRSGRAIKLGTDRRPKIGALSPKPVKQAAALLDAVLVDGLPPTTPAQLDAFLMWVDLTRILAALDRVWPSDVVIPQEDTVVERLQWHVTEVAQLGRVLGLAGELAREEARLGTLGLPSPRWADDRATRAYAGLVDAADAADALAAARAPLDDLDGRLAEEARWADAVPAVPALLDAVRERDHERYARWRRRLERLVEVRRLVGRRDELARRLRTGAARLHTAIEAEPRSPRWPQLLPGFSAAWAWVAAGTFVRDRRVLDINAAQAELTRIEGEIRGAAETVAATRAWARAVAPDRLSRRSRTYLEEYAFLVRRQGKSGKYLARRKAEVRQAMDRCRSAVPVWILPLYRIADQLRIEPDMFDVIVVDEASQAGLEATFLQYLAPRLVVVGDDKQVSPSAVGVDLQQLHDLGNQYLYDNPSRAVWENPQRSFFDAARSRFGGMLTLVEHRRCVPEIIAFSNRVAYEPDGIRLVPVRQFGADRLEPIRTVYLEDGAQRGTTNVVNDREAAALVEQIEKCSADPRYDGLTFGVISLLGTAQAKRIEQILRDRLTEEEWVARDLRCGDAADFQGSERDVMFLSLVTSLEPGRRYAPLTAEMYVQRFNVAASRAKDQMWLFHSVRPEQLGNEYDMRRALLDHCYTVQSAPPLDDGAIGEPVPEHVPVAPFGSLLAQRVCNRLIERGLTVLPRVEAMGHHLDLVVVGSTRRLAIVCETDTWDGPAVFQRELATQRELVRCGWTIVRLRESEFTIAPEAALRPVWEALIELGILDAAGPPRSDTAEQPPDTGAPSAAVPSQDDGDERDDRRAPETPTGGAGVIEPATDGVAMSESVMDDVLATEPTTTGAGYVAALGAASALPPYRSFTGALVPSGTAERAELIEGVVAIVSVEGPVLGHRLHTAYVRSSDGKRVGHQIAKALNSAIAAAVRQGRIVQEDPLRESGVRPATFRLPDQPPVVVRELGPRLFEHVPPAELAAVMAAAAERVGWVHHEQVFRATMHRYGVRKLGANVRARLTEVLPLARPAGEEGNW